MANLPPGDYTLRYELDGDQPFARAKVQLGATVTLRVNAELLPQTLAEVTVEADRSLGLWGSAQRLDGDLHVVVWEDTYRADLPTYAWPSTVSLSDFLAATAPDVRGPRIRVPASGAAPWRELRETFLRDIRHRAARHDGAGIQVRDGEIAARVFMRDALPYEDETGRWPLPNE